MSESCGGVSDYDHGYDVVSTVKDNRTLWYNKSRRTRRNIPENVIDERIVVHIAVPALSVCYI